MTYADRGVRRVLILFFVGVLGVRKFHPFRRRGKGGAFGRMKSGAVEKGKKEGGITVFFLINAPGTDKNEIKSLSISRVILHLFF